MPGAKKPAGTRGQENQARPETPGSEAALLICHELTEPVTALAQYLHAARRLQQGAESDVALAEILDKAETEAARAGGLVRRLRRHLDPGEAGGNG